MVDLVAKSDDSVHIGFKAKFVACCSDNHERSAAILFRNLEEFARRLALDMVAFSVMPERSQQEMPGFPGASEKRHKLFLVSKCKFRFRESREEPNRAPGVTRQASAIGTYLPSWADLPAD